MRRVRHQPFPFVPAPRDGRASTATGPDGVLARGRHRATVVIIGQVDADKAARISAVVCRELDGGASEIVVDLTHAWDGARLLSDLAHRRAEIAERGGVLRLVGVALPEFLAALVAAPLDEVFLVYDAIRGETEARRGVGDPEPGGDARRRRSVQRSADWR